MLNPEVNLRTSAEICSQIGSYFQVVDNCIAVADTNRQYCINPQTSYAPSPPIKGGSYTSVIISPNTHNTADIYNGFIRANMKITLNADAKKPINEINHGDYKFNKLWFGFKDARDAVEKYEIVANGITIYTQNNGCEESFLTACSDNEAVKRSDVYSRARHKDIWNGKYKRCGGIVEWKDEASADINIKLKIDLRRFLPLSNIKYLPAFAGKLELRLYFSCAALLCCPCGPDCDLQNNAFALSSLKLPYITTEFTPIGEPIKVWVGKTDTAANKDAVIPAYHSLVADERTFTVSDYEITECSSIIPCFGISDDVYSSLVQRYSNPEHPLTFPTQTISVFTTTKILSEENDKSTCTITPRFVDSIFCLFPLKHTHHTYFKNPQFTKFQLNCGGYGNIPSKPFSVNGVDAEPEFVEYCQNAMNMNCDQTGFSKDVVASLTNTKEYNEDVYGLYSNDKTSFFIGLPTETDNTFQQGLTSLSPINFEIIVSQNNTRAYRKDVKTPPLICLLYDCSISIWVRPNGQPPLVRIGNYDITTPE